MSSHRPKMFRSDAQENRIKVINISDQIDSLNDDVVWTIEKELQGDPYDMTSLVFLLYPTPDVALQKLIVFQTVSKDSVSTNLNLLHDWLREAKVRKCDWRHELLEALLICQLYGIIKKLGFHVPSLLRHYHSDNTQTNTYINPMKKVLYKICEDMDSENLSRFKLTLKKLKIDANDYDRCELIFLKLMSEKVINATQFNYDKKSQDCQLDAEKLIKIIEKLPNMDTGAKELKELQSKIDGSSPDVSVVSSTSNQASDKMEKDKRVINSEDLSNAFEMFMEIDDETYFQSDNKRIKKNKNYIIKNPRRLGICIIINQENFHLSEKSINDANLKTLLSTRNGSSIDKAVLTRTMSSLNFEVVAADNLDHIEMKDFIINTVRNKVHSTDSMFMLCILSHGVRGHVFAADCVKVNIDDIQDILDSDKASILRGIPKILIIQACQVDDTPRTLVPDGLRPVYKRKSDFIIYWATSPEYEAYRDEKKGSVFIQILCAAIHSEKDEHLYDIFTTVNNGVDKFCSKYPDYLQVPIFSSSLTKKVYLQNPK